MSDNHIISNIVEAGKFILLLFTVVVYLYLGFIYSANVVETGHGDFIKRILLVNLIACKYLTPLNDALWSKQKAVIYSYIKNEYVIWVLDSFLLFPVIKFEWVQQNWQHLILRGSIYYMVFLHLYIPYSIYICMLTLIMIGATKDIIEYFLYPYKTSFDFQTLPHPLQQRFYKLQNPVTRFRFSKTYFPLSLKSAYNKIYVDNIFIRKLKQCHKIYENYVGQQSTANLSIGCNIQEKCKCPEGILSEIYVIKAIHAITLLPGEFSKTLSTLHVNIKNVKFLKISLSELNLKDLKVISTMKIKVAVIYVGQDESTTIQDFLEALIGIPQLRICFAWECGNPDDFAVNLVEWALKNGYIESLAIRGKFLGQILDFKSSKEVNFFDTFDSL